jgi:hypothetical protein
MIGLSYERNRAVAQITPLGGSVGCLPNIAKKEQKGNM